MSNSVILNQKSPEEIKKFWKEHENALALRRKKFEPNTVRIFSYENFQQDVKKLRTSNDGKYVVLVRKNSIVIFENDNLECGLASVTLRTPSSLKNLHGDCEVYICDTHLIVTYKRMFLVYEMPKLTKHVNAFFPLPENQFTIHFANLSSDSKYFYTMNSSGMIARIPLENIDFTQRNFIVEPQYFSQFESFQGFDDIVMSAVKNDLFCFYTNTKLIVVKKDFEKNREVILYTLNVNSSQSILGAEFDFKFDAISGDLIDQYLCIYGNEKVKDSNKMEGLFQMLRMSNLEQVVAKILPISLHAARCMLDENAKGLFFFSCNLENKNNNTENVYYLSFDMSKIHSVCKGNRNSFFWFHPSKRQLYSLRSVYDQFGSAFSQLFTVLMSHRLCGVEASIFYLTVLKYMHAFGNAIKDLEILHIISFFDLCTGKTYNCSAEQITFDPNEFFFNLSYYEQKQLVRGAAFRDWPKRVKLWQDAFQHAQRLHLSRPHFSAAILALEAFFDLFY